MENFQVWEKIAKKIEGEFKGFRDYLSTNASHISFSYESAKHSFDYKTFEIKAIQNQSNEYLRSEIE